MAREREESVDEESEREEDGEARREQADREEVLRSLPCPFFEEMARTNGSCHSIWKPPLTGR